MRISPYLFDLLERIVFLLIPILILASLVYILYSYKNNLKRKSTDLYQYKISNYLYTIGCLTVYLCIFVFLLYAVRVLCISRTVDLKIIYKNVKDIIKEFLLLPIITQIYLLSLIILLIIFILLLFMIFQRMCYKELLKIHILCFKSFIDPRKNIIERLSIYPWYVVLYYTVYDDFLAKQSNLTDLISGYIFQFLFRLQRNYEKKYKKEHNIYWRISSILFSTYYKWFFKFLPFLFIFYECIFNNWVLVNTFYFLLIYTPLVQLKRLFESLYRTCNFFIVMLQQIYYHNDKYIICVPIDMFDALNQSLMNQFKYNRDYEFPRLDYLIFFGAYKEFFVLPSEYNNMYSNYNGSTLVKQPDGKLYLLEYEYEEGKYDLGEEWVVVEDKYKLMKDYQKPNKEKSK